MTIEDDAGIKEEILLDSGSVIEKDVDTIVDDMGKKTP